MKDRNKIKVCMVISTYYPEWGGAQKQLHQIGPRLKERGIEPFILTRRPKGAKMREEIGSIEVYRIPVTNRIPVFDSFLFFIFSLIFLIKNRHSYDILHCYQAYSPAYIGVFAKLILRNKKVVVKVTASDEYGEVNEIRRLPLARFRIRLLKLVDKFFVVNEQIKKELGSIGIRSAQVEYVPNGVEVPPDIHGDDSAKQSLRAELGIGFEKIAIFTGRLSKEKCLDTLLMAWDKVCGMHPEAHLIVLGSGSAHRNIEMEIKRVHKEMSHPDNVHFLGHKENISAYLEAADIFVLPSISEGLSNSLLEAMAAGLAVVAGDNRGNRQLVTDGDNGLLVEPGDAEALYEKIVFLLEDTSTGTGFGRKARQTIERGHDIEAIADKYKYYYSKMLRAAHDIIERQ